MGRFQLLNLWVFGYRLELRFGVVIAIIVSLTLTITLITTITIMGDSSVFVLSRTGHFEHSPVHNSVNINGRNFILHLHGICHMCVSMCDQNFFVNYFNWLIYS